jgi:Ca2+/Na+ antiporter
VNAETDERDAEELKEDNTAKGIKKIKDQGVYFTTTIFALFAYIWLYVCLLDGEVTPLEAWLTLFYFIVLIVVSYGMDKLGESKAAKQKKKESIE